MNKKGNVNGNRNRLTSSEGFIKASNLIFSASSSMVPTTGDLFNALYTANIDKNLEENN